MTFTVVTSEHRLPPPIRLGELTRRWFNDYESNSSLWVETSETYSMEFWYGA